MARPSSIKHIFQGDRPGLKQERFRLGKVNYQRVIIKISGEMLGGEGIFSFKTFEKLALELGYLNRLGLKIGVVVGGGNIGRGRDLKKIGRIEADWIGMTATLINGLMLKYFLENHRIKTAIFSGVEVEGAARRFTVDRARPLYENGHVLVLVYGTGNPAFSTDTAVALRAVELGAEVIIKGTKVEGVYERDPVVYPKAKFYARLTYDEAIKKHLAVMDTAAFSLCADNSIKIHIFNFSKYPLREVIFNPKIGSQVH